MHQDLLILNQHIFPLKDDPVHTTYGIYFHKQRTEKQDCSRTGTLAVNHGSSEHTSRQRIHQTFQQSMQTARTLTETIKEKKIDQERLRSPYQDTPGARQEEAANHGNGGNTDRPDQARRRGGEEKEKGKR